MPSDLYDDTIRRQTTRMLERTDTILTMAISLLEPASQDLARGWHHDISGMVQVAATQLRKQREIVRERLDTGFGDDETDD